MCYRRWQSSSAGNASVCFPRDRSDTLSHFRCSALGLCVWKEFFFFRAFKINELKTEVTNRLAMLEKRVERMSSMHTWHIYIYKYDVVLCDIYIWLLLFFPPSGGPEGCGDWKVQERLKEAERWDDFQRRRKVSSWRANQTMYILYI